MSIISMEDLPLKKTVKKIILPTISYSSKNLTVKDEDEDLVCYLLMNLQDNHHNYLDLHKISEILIVAFSCVIKTQNVGQKKFIKPNSQR